jgi:NADP-dependent 3-hydroxy acid dehydrogenase YdfG
LIFRAKLNADGLKTVKFVRIDVTDIASIQAAKETIEKAEGKLDVLVNNAGTSLPVDILQSDHLNSKIISHW